MDDSLTLVLHYYNNRRSVDRNIKNFLKLSPAHHSALEIVLVDDCSADEERVDYEQLLSQSESGALDLTVYRIAEDIPWNQTGARNLGCFQAKTDWLFCTDIDHVMFEDDIVRLIQYLCSGLDINSLYRVQRRSIQTRESQAPHANTFLVHRDSFMAVGGYDEDFAGGAGHSDKYFFHLWHKAGKKIAHLDDVYVYVDVDARTRKLSRNPDRNRQLYEKKLSGEIPENPKRINFDWQLEFSSAKRQAAQRHPEKGGSSLLEKTSLKVATAHAAETSQPDKLCDGEFESLALHVESFSESENDPANGRVIRSGGAPESPIGIPEPVIPAVPEAERDRLAELSSSSVGSAEEVETGKSEAKTLGSARQTLEYSELARDTSGFVPTPQPLMTIAEIALFKAAIASKTCAVEFGTGGSTFLLVGARINRIVSVDSDERWVRSVAQHPAVASSIESGQLTVQYVDVGRIRKWGYPDNEERRAFWHHYWEDAWSYVDPSSVDLVVIDGRFRVACGLNALLTENGDMTIIIHDFWTRVSYHELLKYCNCAARSDNLAVLFPKKSINFEEVREDLQTFAGVAR